MEMICANGESAFTIATDAYVYAYPLVLMDATMRKETNVPAIDVKRQMSPVNQFLSLPTFPTASFHDVVRPNADTLYSIAWLDVREEPVIISVPDTQGRYYLLQLLDMWTDVFASLGKRTTGTHAGHFAIVSQAWQGELPEGMPSLHAPTDHVWIIGRTQTNGPGDYTNVHKIQAGYQLTPLHQWGQPYTPPENLHVDPTIDMETPPPMQVDRMDGATFFARVAELLAHYPPHGNDYPILQRMSYLGLIPGQPFDVGKLDAAMLSQAVQEGQRRIRNKTQRNGTVVNHWLVNLENMGTYGTSYLQRAAVACMGLGANLPEDAVYPSTFVDADNEPLTGQHAYRLHFEKDQLPPANAFWSVSMYDENSFFVENSLNRYAVGDRDPLRYHADGSLDIYIQASSPGKEWEANWLPAPVGAFNLSMRLYWPKAEVLMAEWQPVPVRNLGAMPQQQRPAA